MKVVFIADAHLISDNDRYTGLHITRGFLKNAWKSFERLITLIRNEAPDHVIFLGDLVDWFSEENVLFAMELIAELQIPWSMTPGNHDIESPKVEPHDTDYVVEPSEHAEHFWRSIGCDWSPAAIDDGFFRIQTFPSPLSQVSNEDIQWLKDSSDTSRVNIYATHVPINIEPVRERVLSIDPTRDLRKYVQSRTPQLYEEVIRHQVVHVFTGHLHFPASVDYERTTFHMLGMSVTIPGHSPASATVIETSKAEIAIKKLELSHVDNEICSRN